LDLMHLDAVCIATREYVFVDGVVQALLNVHSPTRVYDLFPRLSQVRMRERMVVSTGEEMADPSMMFRMILF